MGREKERVQITIRLPAELKEKLQQAADQLDLSFNGLITDYLWNALERK